jgi:hypothetical protein
VLEVSRTAACDGSSLDDGDGCDLALSDALAPALSDG